MRLSRWTTLYLGLFLLGTSLGVTFFYVLKEKKVAEKPAAPILTKTVAIQYRPSTDSERILQKSLGYGKGLSTLFEALEDPESENFRFLRSEFLQGIESYSTTILPPLKEKSLEEMLRRFEQSDWEAWPKANIAVEGRPSKARTYVDSVFTQNRELGLFLETSALLLHGLYLSTARGAIYDLKKGFDEVVNQAEELLVNYQSSSLPARYLLSYSVPSDPSFLPIFERQRCKLVAQYAITHPQQVERNVRLLASLDGRYSSKESNRELTSTLIRISQDASPRFRAQVVKELIESGQFRDFFLADESVKKAAAHLAAVASVDALEKKELLRSKQLLGVSLGLAQGLASQQLVLGFYREYGLGLAVSPGVPGNSTPQVVRAVTPQGHASSEGVKLSFFGSLLLLLGVIGSLIIIILAKRSRDRSTSAAFVRRPALDIDPLAIKSPNLLTDDLISGDLAKGRETEHSSRKVVNLVRT